MPYERLLLECTQCGKGKLIDVAVSQGGMMGPVKCDECKAQDLLHGIGMRGTRSRTFSARI